MKTPKPRFVLSVLTVIATVCLAFASSSEARHEGETARLYIKRSPNLGNLAYVAVRIDGRDAGGILWARDYDRIIPAGRHVIEVKLAPAEHNYSSSSIVLDARPGHTYTFQALKRGGALVLGKF